MWSAAVKSEALVGLRHQVADVDLGGGRFDNRLRNAAHQQVGDEAGEQRSRTDRDHVGVGDGLKCLRHRPDVRAEQETVPGCALCWR